MKVECDRCGIAIETMIDEYVFAEETDSVYCVSCNDYLMNYYLDLEVDRANNDRANNELEDK